MKSVIDSYIGIWLIMFFLMLCIAFTSINMNVMQARRMYDDIKAQVQASNGSFVPTTGDQTFRYDSTTQKDLKNRRTLKGNGYEYQYDIVRKQQSSNLQASDETWIYNDIYYINFRYTYTVPLFGGQLYPIVGYTY